MLGAPKKTPLSWGQRGFPGLSGVADGARTHDNRNHNPGLYQLSYSHRRTAIICRSISVWPPARDLRLQEAPEPP